MKVILKQDVKSLGKKDSIVDVNDGYARNFLIPRGLAVEATNENVNLLKNKKTSENLKKEKEIKNANEIKDKLSKINLVIKARAGENGKLFGTISNKDIAEHLKKEHGIEVDRKKISLSEPIRMLGTYTADIKLYTEINAKITVNVVAE